MAISYYITARRQLAPGAEEEAAEQALRQKVRAAFSAGLDYVQVREKDMPAGRLAGLIEALRRLPEKRNTRLLVNERLDIAVSCGADGVHLPSDSLPLAAVRSAVRSKMGAAARAGIFAGISCHTEPDVEQATREGASYILLGPVFETPSKPGALPLGLAGLEKICRRATIPVFALGGVSLANARDCIQAGAAGVAGIRSFQQAENLDELCRSLRAL